MWYRCCSCVVILVTIVIFSPEMTFLDILWFRTSFFTFSQENSSIILPPQLLRLATLCMLSASDGREADSFFPATFYRRLTPDF